VTISRRLFRIFLIFFKVKEGTDALSNRKHLILYKLLAPIFEKKDDDRLFNEEQRRILWNSAGVKCCPYCPPSRKPGWSDLAIDHIKPHALGGKTILDNGQICCRMHNSKMGKKTNKAA
jgi:HNH endonuclease